jgi:hypothetical protein
MTDQLTVAACGADVVITVDGRDATLTPHQAQSFAFDLARAYARAGDMSLGPHGNLVLRREEDSCTPSLT